MICVFCHLGRFCNVRCLDKPRMFPGEDYISQCNTTSHRLKGQRTFSIVHSSKLADLHNGTAEIIFDESNWCCDSEDFCNSNFTLANMFPSAGTKSSGRNLADISDHRDDVLLCAQKYDTKSELHLLSKCSLINLCGVQCFSSQLFLSHVTVILIHLSVQVLSFCSCRKSSTISSSFRSPRRNALSLGKKTLFVRILFIFFCLCVNAQRMVTMYLLHKSFRLVCVLL